IPPLITPVPDSDPDDGCTAERWLYEGGTNGSSVELYKVFDGAHTWPGTDIIIGTTNQDFNASAVIWEFFSQYDINGLTIVDDVEEQAKETLRLWPNPAQDRLYIDHLERSRGFRIVDGRGRTVMQSELSAHPTVIDIAELREGNYLLILDDGRSTPFLVD
ncbi:MAG: hypothetical protein HKN79_02555, partial [Flavobacteriales bacterium]|nr:hypothetical protein [Flavobacteriales bacterium]